MEVEMEVVEMQIEMEEEMEEEMEVEMEEKFKNFKNLRIYYDHVQKGFKAPLAHRPAPH